MGRQLDGGIRSILEKQLTKAPTLYMVA